MSKWFKHLWHEIIYRKEVVCSIIIAAILVFGAGFLVGKGKAPIPVQPKYTETHSNFGQFKFINPLLQCDNVTQATFGDERHPLEQKIRDIISDQTSKGNIDFASVYYRDLNNGPWIGVNENERFFPASLMKIPVLMYFYHRAESEPGLLARKIDGSKVPQEIDFDTYFPPRRRIDPTKTYTVEELLDSMIKNSDNYAANNLVSIMEPNAFDKLLSDLYIERPQNTRDDYITVLNYATFFRVLFNASYLSYDDSEKALALLSQSTFNSGITKYLPPNVTVAHKFGEHEVEGTKEKQLHDCGIVYVPDQPYLLCIMTRGNDMIKMSDVIGQISKYVYDSLQ